MMAELDWAMVALSLVMFAGVERIQRIAERELSEENRVLTGVGARKDETVVRRARHLDAVEVEGRLLRSRGGARADAEEGRGAPASERESRWEAAPAGAGPAEARSG